MTEKQGCPIEIGKESYKVEVIEASASETTSQDLGPQNPYEAETAERYSARENIFPRAKIFSFSTANMPGPLRILLMLIFFSIVGVFALAFVIVTLIVGAVLRVIAPRWAAKMKARTTLRAFGFQGPHKVM
jgi:hypothetical protein